jgi:trehalose synthase
MPADRREGGHRRALAVATGRYRSPALPDLDSPGNDAELMQRVLGDERLGGFDSIAVLRNADLVRARDAIYDFFVDSAGPDDFLLAYFSGHGLKDVEGELFLATIETDPDRLLPSAIPAYYVADCLHKCRARRVIVVMDCCYAGAFLNNLRPRGDIDRVIIVSANSVQLAHEGADGSEPSIFGHAFFTGVESGEADFDGNGWISVREAFDYAAERVRQSGRDQSPRMDARVTGDLWLARAPVSAGTLPAELTALIGSDRAALRIAAVEDLSGWLAAGDPARIAVAERTLTELRADPDEKVASQARRALARRDILAAIAPAAGPTREPRWYKKAVFYEVRVRSFADGDGDGIGDLRGLIDRLDYIRWLGVDCLVLSSIFDSPLLDDGNDVSDFTAIHPVLGELPDFVELIDAAHRRRIGVVLDLVLNHTSDRHRWFQESRADPEGPYADFYVWRSDAEVEPAAQGPAEAQWTYDPVRRQHYWHRFQSHMPDLNFDNPAVQEAMMEVIRYWLDLGVDGYRLTAAPYLYEREGTSGEGLEETHDYLRLLRSEVDRLYPGRILLADTNHWPRQAAEYFGDKGNECHMVLYTSLIARVFLAMRKESHEAVSQVLAETPPIPDGCQWGVFLRNGDELSLAGIDGHDRESLIEAYAPSPRMLTAHGIRRRLAPLVGGDRTLLELCGALLFSLPGSPCLYYGDEIGLGDNMALAGRDSLRTPMQWSPDRNAGFSSAPPDRLVLPVLVDPVYGYQATNVEAQTQSRSLLQFTRRLIEIRRHSLAFAYGGLTLVDSGNPAVLAYLRSHGPETMVCVLNFSRFPQAARLDLGEYAGRTPVEVLGGARFTPVGSEPYSLTMAGHGFYWLTLT